jgi:RNase P protein component
LEEQAGRVNENWYPRVVKLGQKDGTTRLFPEDTQKEDRERREWQGHQGIGCTVSRKKVSDAVKPGRNIEASKVPDSSQEGFRLIA